MSYIEASKILPILTGSDQNHNDFEDLVRSILVLEDQINHSDQQSVYFQWGIENHRKHLVDLKEEYQRIKSVVNNNDFDTLVENLEKVKEKLKDIPTFGMISQIVRTSELMKIAKLEMVLDIKARFKNLKDLQEENLKRFFE